MFTWASIYADLQKNKDDYFLTGNYQFRIINTLLSFIQCYITLSGNQISILHITVVTFRCWYVPSAQALTLRLELTVLTPENATKSFK